MSGVALYLLIGVIFALVSTIVDFIVYGKRFYELLREECGPNPFIQVLALIVAMAIIAVGWPWYLIQIMAKDSLK